MTQQPAQRPIRRGRIFPEHTIPQEELARRKAEREERYQRCRPVFEQVRFGVNSRPLQLVYNY